MSRRARQMDDKMVAHICPREIWRCLRPSGWPNIDGYGGRLARNH